MEREFIKLPNGDKIIKMKDENGTIYMKAGSKEVVSKGKLVLENQIDHVKYSINSINRELVEDKKIVNASKKLMVVPPIAVGGATLVGFVLGGLAAPSNFLNNGLFYGIVTFLESSIIGGEVMGCLAINKSIFKRRIRGTENELAKAEELKDTYSKEYEERYNLEEKVSVNHITQVQNTELISIVEDVEHGIDQVDAILKEANKAGRKAKVKSKVLTRN